MSPGSRARYLAPTHAHARPRHAHATSTDAHAHQNDESLVDLINVTTGAEILKIKISDVPSTFESSTNKIQLTGGDKVSELCMRAT